MSKGVGYILTTIVMRGCVTLLTSPPGAWWLKRTPAFTQASQLPLLTIPAESLTLVQEKLGSNNIDARKDFLTNLLRKY